MNLLASFIGLPMLTSPIVYLVGHQSNFRRKINPHWFSLLMLVVLWTVWCGIAFLLESEEVIVFNVGMIHLRMDGLSFLISSLSLLLSTVTILFSFHDIEDQTSEEKYYAMIFILTGMIMGLVCAGDLFNLWVWFEGTAISSYLLIAFYNQKADALAACVKYFVQTAVGSVLVLFGIGLVLIQTGTLDLAVIKPSASPLLTIAGALFVMGFGVKAALFPSFTWLPDAYAESPTGVSSLLSGVVTVTGLVALLKVLSVVMVSQSQWATLFLVIAAFNIIIGNFLALAQTEVKRILAYSSISHIGFILLAIGIGLFTHSQLAMQASVLHLFIHGLMKSLAFLAIGTFMYALGRKSSQQLTINDLRGVAQRYPAMAVALVIGLLSLAGVPLLAGFISKWQIFIAGIQSGSGWIIALMIFAALNSVFSLAYYLPIINALSSTPDDARWQHTPQIPLSMRLSVITLVLLILLIGIFPNLIDWLIHPAGKALFALVF